MKGDLRLDVVWGGKFKKIIVPEGHCFLLPSHVPHSPKRPAHSVGIVVERGHEHAPEEIDRMRWYLGPHTEGTLAAADDSGLPHGTPGHAQILYGALACDDNLFHVAIRQLTYHACNLQRNTSLAKIWEPNLSRSSKGFKAENQSCENLQLFLLLSHQS